MWNAVAGQTLMLLTDVKRAVRMYRRAPAFAATAVVTFALGVGATATIFSFINGVLLKPLPFERPERLVLAWETSERMRAALGFSEFPVAPGMVTAWQQRARTVENLAAFRSGFVNLAGDLDEAAERVRAAYVQANLFELLGVRAALGRTFTADEDAPGRDDVVVLSWRLWHRRYAGARDIVGRSIRVDDRPVTVIGVMPEGFGFPRGNEHPRFENKPEDTLLWRPQPYPPQQANFFGNHPLGVVARLRQGAGVADASRELDAIEKDVMGKLGSKGEFGAFATGYLDNLVRQTRPALLLLGAAVLLVLLIACVNVAGLLLVQSLIRSREIAVRSALGGGWRDLLRQSAIENGLLAIAGCAAGCLLAQWSVPLLKRFAGPRVPRLDAVTVDFTVVAFAAGVALLSALAVSAAPVWLARKVNPGEALKQGGRGSSAGHHRLRSVLVVAEIALSMVLLTAAGLLARSLLEVVRADRGYQTSHMLTVRIPLARYRYTEGHQRVAFFDRLIERVRALPGVDSAALIAKVPLTGDQDINTVTIEGRSQPKMGEEPIAEFRETGAGYFETLRLGLVAGRFFRESDTAGAPLTAVINQTMAGRFWPGENPIGKRFKRGQGAHLPWLTVVGVVRDARQSNLEQTPRPQAYQTYRQSPVAEMSVVVRTLLEPRKLASAVTAEVRALDRDQPVLDVRTLEDLVDEALTYRRLQSGILASFAVFGLALAVVGIHGVVAWSVAQRTREFGIRIALGAPPLGLLRTVMGEGIRLAAAGVGVGVAGSLAAGRLLSGYLYGIKASDPLTLAGVSALLTLSAAVAAFLPARAAAGVDPAGSLRAE